MFGLSIKGYLVTPTIKSKLHIQPDLVIVVAIVVLFMSKLAGCPAQFARKTYLIIFNILDPYVYYISKEKFKLQAG